MDGDESKGVLMRKRSFEKRIFRNHFGMFLSRKADVLVKFLLGLMPGYLHDGLYGYIRLKCGRPGSW